MPLVAAEIAALIDSVWPNGCCNTDPVLELLHAAYTAALGDNEPDNSTNQTQRKTMNKQQNRNEVEQYPVGSYALLPDVERAIRNEQDGITDRYTYGPAALRQTFLQGDDALWAVEAHASGHEGNPYTVILFGNEDSPCQVWASNRVAFRPAFDELERIA